MTPRAGISEVVVLSDELSQEALVILQDRGVRSRPVSRYGRMLKCHAGGEALRPELVCGGGEGGGCSAPTPKRPKSQSQATIGQTCRKRAYQFLPFLGVLPSVTRKTVQADVIAGITVVVMVIPQSMSYASIAGLPYIYGMYAACVPALVYVLLGQSRQLAVGPVAMVSLLIEAGLSGKLTPQQCPASYGEHGVLLGERPQYEYPECQEAYAQLAIFTAAVVGLMQVAARVLKLGFLVSFLGHPVTSGFTSGAAIIIGCSQLKHILGYKVAKSEHLHATVYNIAKDLDQTNEVTLALGIAWILFLVGCKKLGRRGGRFALIGPLGPLLSCAAGILLIAVVRPLREDFGVDYVGEIPSGRLPPVSVQHWDFSRIGDVLPTALSACLIGYMESIAIGKNLAAKHGYEIDAGQELLSLGLSNIVGAMFSCYPVTGSFSRSAVSNATGAVTQLAGLVTGLAMMITLLFLTKAFYYLPQFVLAAVVMSSIMPLIAYTEAIKLWRVKREDFVLWMTAFLGTLFLGVLVGIGLAVGLSLVIVIYESVRPQITILWRIPGTTMYRSIKQESSGAFVPNVFVARIGSSMYFANASFIKDMLLTYVEDLEDVNKTEYIVLEMTPVVSVDSTALHVLHDIVGDFRSRGVQVAFAMVGNRVERTIRNARLNEFIGDGWFFPTVHDAVASCLQHRRHMRRRFSTVSTVGSSASMLHHLYPAVDASPDHCGNPDLVLGTEVGFSNNYHHAGTALFISLEPALDGTLHPQPSELMGALAAALSRRKLSMVRAQVEPLCGDDERQGVRHTYILQNLSTRLKLDESEIAKLREDLQDVLFPSPASAPPASFAPPAGSVRGDLVFREDGCRIEV